MICPLASCLSPTGLTFCLPLPLAAALGRLDIGVTVAYLLLIVGLGVGVGLRHRRRGGEAKEYFLAGGTLRWPMIGLALFATNISCVHLVSLAQTGFDNGLLYGNFEWMAAFTLVLLALFFAPFYIRSRVATLPDFLEQRYSRRCRDWLAVLSVASAVTVHIGFSFVTGGIVLEDLFDIPMMTSIVGIGLLTGLYTAVGGLMAVVLTESIQTVVLVGGAMLITWFAWDKMGGWQPMVETLRAHGEMKKLSMLPTGGLDTLSWYAVFLGYPVLGIWYWCADQTIVQRVLGAKDVNHARVGPLFAGLIKILPVFIFVLPGLLAYTLYLSGKLDLSSMEGPEGLNTKGVYGAMITQLLPPGLIGILVAALLAALMSTVSGALNSISTLVSYDLVRRFRPQTADHHLVIIGRITAVAAVLAAIALVPLLNRYESLFLGVNEIIAHLAPPVTCVFMLGVFWKRASAFSAELTLWLGSALGVAVFVINKTMGDASPLAGIHFMMMAFFLLMACVLIQVLASVLWPAVHTERSRQLVWDKPWTPLLDKGWTGLGDHRFLAAMLLGTMAILYFIFH